jgi:hypothetical protein
MSDWRVAKSAPKDGSRVLIFDQETNEVQIAWWKDDDWHSALGPLGRSNVAHWRPNSALRPESSTQEVNRRGAAALLFVASVARRQ